MPRILRIVNRFNLGGPTYNAANLSCFLSDDFETLLIGGGCQQHEASSEFILDKLHLDYKVLEEMGRDIHWMRDRQALRAIGRIIDTFKPDIVHTHASKAGALGRLAASRRKVPAIVHTFHGHVFHSYFGPVKTAIYKNAERYLARLTDAIVAISDTQRDELVHTYRIAPANKVEVIPLGFELERFQENQQEMRSAWRNRMGLREDELAIGMVGRLTPIKNHEFFLQVIDSLKQEFESFKAVVIGGGELEQSLKSAASPLGDHVVFAGWEREIERAMAGLDIVVLTSDNEGTPVSLIEAQAAGNPVISTDVGGVRDVVKDNMSGFLVQKGDVDDYTRKLLKLARDKDLRETMGVAGKQHVFSTFSHIRLAADMEALYRRLLA